MQPSFSGLFVTWANFPKIKNDMLEKMHLKKRKNWSKWSSNQTLTPNDLPALCDQSELADVDLDDRSFGDDPQCGVQWGGGVLLHPQDGQTERRL